MAWLLALLLKVYQHTITPPSTEHFNQQARHLHMFKTIGHPMHIAAPDYHTAGKGLS
jgi:hypothetical protein